MKMKSKVFLVLALSTYSIFYGQMQSYEYTHEILGIKDQWHTLVIPAAVFGKVSKDLSDIRIFGITKNQDTIEAPYIVRIASKQKIKNAIPFRKLNTAKNEKGSFFTFEIPKTEIINHMELSFQRNNFDWELRLEGSQDQKEWFTIKDNYRILSIKNKRTDYKFTEVLFSDSKYHFYRILIRSNEDPKLMEAKIFRIETKEGSYIDHAMRDPRIQENKNKRQTALILDLVQPSRVSYLQIRPKDTFDYYRPITIQYLSDSIKTEKGWKYSYQNLMSGTLTSIEANEFTIPDTTIKKLKVIVYNEDNQPLNFGSIALKGYKYELIARFTEPARYFLTYGNKTARKPSYDIKKFSNSIPDSLAALRLGRKQKIEKKTLPLVKPLFENKLWLWLVMGIIILLLGGFSLKMMRQKK